jgi:hypothetical protein
LAESTPVFQGDAANAREMARGFQKSDVAQIFNLLYRGFAIRIA